MTKEFTKISEAYDGFIMGSYIFMAGIIMYVATKIGKKIADFIYKAILEKGIKSIEEIVNNKIKPLESKINTIEKSLIQYREDHHGVIKTNEGVLNLAMDQLKEYSNKLELMKKRK